MNERYIVENQDGDTLFWVAIAATDNLDQAKGLLTSCHRRIMDTFDGTVIEFDSEGQAAPSCPMRGNDWELSDEAWWRKRLSIVAKRDAEMARIKQQRQGRDRKT